jgi:hypothetical protein
LTERIPSRIASPASFVERRRTASSRSLLISRRASSAGERSLISRTGEALADLRDERALARRASVERIRGVSAMKRVARSRLMDAFSAASSGV